MTLPPESDRRSDLFAHVTHVKYAAYLRVVFHEYAYCYRRNVLKIRVIFCRYACFHPIHTGCPRVSVPNVEIDKVEPKLWRFTFGTLFLGHPVLLLKQC